MRRRDDRVAWVAALSSHKVGEVARGSQYNSVELDRAAGSSPDPSSTALSGPAGLTTPATSSSMRSAQRADANLKKLLPELVRNKELSEGGAAKIDSELGPMRGGLATAAAALRAKEGECRQLLDERRQLQTEMVASTRRPTANVRHCVISCWRLCCIWRSTLASCARCQAEAMFVLFFLCCCCHYTAVRASCVSN